MAQEKVLRVSDIEALIAEKAFLVETGTIPPPNPEPEELRLLWPTNYKVVTQWYGINKHLYSKFGLPGHEGLDMRAPMGDPVFAVADGEVYRVEVDEDNHNYGIHVRIKHPTSRGLYKSVYAHFMETDLRVGDMVKRGQILGRANNTGNSYGAHLHFTLKLEGIGDDSFMPYDIVNPVPYFADLWPGNGWQVAVGGNLRSRPEVASDSLIRYLAPGPIVEALDFHNDWWKIEANGTVGWLWEPGYKLSAV